MEDNGDCSDRAPYSIYTHINIIHTVTTDPNWQVRGPKRQ
jgi:hypothetical protein